jgi:hypothetical protein
MQQGIPAGSWMLLEGVGRPYRQIGATKCDNGPLEGAGRSCRQLGATKCNNDPLEGAVGCPCTQQGILAGS